MDILLTGDLHLTNKTPSNRLDDFEETCLRKLDFVLQTAKDQASVIFQPGDLFDNHTVSNDFLIKVFRRIKNSSIYFFTVYGQHDLKHRNKGNTSLDVLAATCPNMILLHSGSQSSFTKDIEVYGSSYGEDIPKINTPDKFNILILHRMIIDEKVWEQQKEFDWGKSFLRRNKFDIIVSGDNHKSFALQEKDQILFNNGSMLRSRIDQVNHKPYIMIYNFETKKYNYVYIPIQNPSEVFRMEEVAREEKRDEKIKAFVDGLDDDQELGTKFEDNMHVFIQENNVPKEIANILLEDMMI